MSEKREWEQFFDAHAPDYMDNVFVKNTQAEIEFLTELMELEPGSSILDVGCGTGRHSVRLADNGLSVTGVDLSTGMLDLAREASRALGVDVDWIKADASSMELDKNFDHAICLCEGSFGLLSAGDDPHEHDLNVLQRIYSALSPGGTFVLNALYAGRMNGIHGPGSDDEVQYDPELHIELGTYEAGKISVTVRERGYMPDELRKMLEMSGFTDIEIWGGTAGNWGKRPVDPDDFELMAFCRKP